MPRTAQSYALPKGAQLRPSKRHQFVQEEEGGTRPWKCHLRMTRCQATVQDGRRTRRCQRWSFRHPFCLPHARALLGVTVRPSRVPGAGCGLFTVRPFQKGDVMVPYTGEWMRMLADDKRTRRKHSP